MPSDRLAVTMPRLGESIVEGTLVAWRVGVGDAVTRGQIVAEVETDKATSEIPAPSDGLVVELLVEEGTTVEVGAPLMRLEGRAEPRARADAPPAEPEAPAAAPPPPDAASTGRDRLPPQRLAPRPVDEVGGPARSSPAVRRLARGHGLDITAVPGSGRGGRVTRDDVLRFVEARGAAPSQPPVPSLAPRTALPEPAPTPSTPPPVARAEQTPFATRLPAQAGLPSAPPPAGAPIARPRSIPPEGQAFSAPGYSPLPRDEVRPFTRRRAQIADHMTYSLQTAAHVAAVAEIDMHRVTLAKAADAPIAARAGVKLTFLPYVVRALARALVEYPQLNATVVDRNLVLRGERNIGVAVDTEAGLVVPVVKRADELTLLGLARAIETLSERARGGALTPDDVAGGTFSLSNPGRDGNLFGVSVIRQPEVGILRIGAIVKRPVVREIDGEDVIVVRPIMYAALSYDHRVVDGRVGNGFLSTFSRILAQTEPRLAE